MTRSTDTHAKPGREIVTLQHILAGQSFTQEDALEVMDFVDALSERVRVLGAALAVVVERHPQATRDFVVNDQWGLDAARAALAGGHRGPRQ